ncbi:DNA-binding protein [Plenodomus tracheiphilus IPT5]|uniref:DNA-binding protein n=1 Tax=Plenodomus tracheiphilus IPT5 TaxID=1408161 RepID=A0A6A7BLP8_9PLEO|nr:DNA-binding protein [Plenodomus tracheiphilus IPT5]
MAPTYLETLSAFTTFLTAYTHTLLYLRTLYPRTSFVQTRFHNTSVYQSRHPSVCEWVRDAVAAVREELLEGTVSRIAIVIFSYGGEENRTGSAKIMERYMFDVGSFPVVEKNERNMEIEWDYHSSEAGDSENEEGEGVRPTRKEKALDTDTDVNLSEQFRAALLSLTTRTAQLSPLPSHCSFNISMELKEEGDVDPPIGHPQAWIPVQPSLQKTGRKATSRDEDEEEQVELGRRSGKSEGSDLGGVKVTPIRSVEAGVFRFETWVEEGKAKFEGRGDDSSKTIAASLGT